MIELTRFIILCGLSSLCSLFIPSCLHQWLDLLSQTPIQINKCLLIVLIGSTLADSSSASGGVSESASATKSSSFTCRSRHSYLSIGVSGLLLSFLADTVFVIQSVMCKKKKKKERKKKMMTVGTSVWLLTPELLALKSKSWYQVFKVAWISFIFSFLSLCSNQRWLETPVVTEGTPADH